MTEDLDYRFIGHLEALRERRDRAALAALRRALGKEPGAAPEAYPIVMPYLPEGAGDRVERIHFLVGSLFALHQKSWPRTEGDRSRHDLGASMRILAERRPGGGVERRFGALLACDEAELGEHLRHVVALLKSEEVPIDWARLLADLKEWNYERRPVQRRWARSFWAGTGVDGEQAQGNEKASIGGRSDVY
jgi:CRISPR system Cascade subunit CasB